ncbi:penicillin-binding transpeptidase domain-containing protein [Cellulomonas alba]|uniref:Penicillin-binding transpeptidase domain-containing protein n=1 Tax=Cellulomonas alba TaxID=3053467 RepID=A0ABT7SFH3_9CELL|nr:penicillin-binding transpeptidase domain-containing protein [Cellulomonas alba]MDM7854948.1 penicillin-binding transpeptidase domain-containing protein [Cellulomonas alba]
MAEVARARRAARWSGGALAALLVATSLTACGSQPPGPQAAGKALAAAVGSGTFDAVHFAPGTDATAAADARTAAYDGLAPWAPKVVATTTAAADDKDQATARLAFTWDVGAARPWTYTTQASLSRDPHDKKVWLVTWNPAILAPDLTDGEKLVDKRERATRADILDGDGNPLVTPRPVHAIGIDKTRIAAAQQAAAAKALAKAVGIDADAYAAQVAKAGSKAFVVAITVRDSDPDFDIPKLARMAGVNAVPGQLPLAPTRTFARPVLGSVGDATADIVTSSHGAIVAGDQTGLSGLERQYDAQLRGTPGLTIRAVAQDGSAARDLFHVDPKPGTPLGTTLDVDTQKDAERVLADVKPASAVVAIRPSTGAVLAVASGPVTSGQSVATLGEYAPGSTLKIATALAMLRDGATKRTTMACAPSVTVAGREFRNTPDYPSSKLGSIPLTTAFAHSCNTAFIGERDTVSQGDLAAAAASLGLTGTPSFGLPAFLGDVPAEASGTDHAASLIGQGRVVASPLGMATVVASVAAGHTVNPSVVDRASVVAGAGGAGATGGTGATSTAAASAPAAPAKPLTAAEASTLRTLMRGVVTDGTATLLQDVPGGPVLAKTGTAQFGPTGDTKNHAWLVAIQGDLAVCVYVDEGDFGATTAGPILKRFLTLLHG